MFMDCPMIQTLNAKKILKFSANSKMLTSAISNTEEEINLDSDSNTNEELPVFQSMLLYRYN